MNIQQVSRHPRKCARALDDIRLRKMVLEAAQMLCTVLNLEADPTGETKVTPYKNSHVHNPLTKWSMDPVNWAWLWHWGNELGEEYMFRFGRRHASHLVIQGLTFNYGKRIKKKPMPKRWHNSARHLGLGIDYSHIEDTREAYKAYLNHRWRLQSITPRKTGKVVPPVWTKRGPPSWCEL